MKVVFITGNHPRHAFIARKIHESGFLSAVIIENRENFIPSPPDHLDDDIKKLFNHHFAERDRVEAEMFGKINWPDTRLEQIELSELNGSRVHSILKEINPDLLITYGCHMIDDETLACVSGEKWNCHGGLSPWYKGAITHFWPSYMLEPQMTGMTVHDLTNQLDAGDVVHQCASDLVPGDTLHMLAARAVLKLGDEIATLIHHLSDNETLEKKAHKTPGMLWLGSRWKPEHLKLIYDHYDDKIVDHYLNGDFENTPPKLFRQFP
ncbi:formyltransferase family protein [Pseudemcibacter aquimaris]|uniref:formyltransferase family protein n=1 Tax=Pseudemcibacter aquimaris TaxID=2857064 RepID=UPI002013155C|nr:formyltransferase family protein [Pseudemcibacter aquimaris]MCC3860057.1 hypothetical protein [Pseudemcibacter aquimaris]WDU57387.1 hypothetical protein KW060_09265 [Pseudemcibacter aquimaris]